MFLCVTGMSEKHQMIEKFSLTEYTKVQRRLHHEVLLDQHQQGKIILPPDKLLLTKSQSSSGDSSASSENGSEPASSDSDDDFNIDDYYFLQPVTTKQRRVLLRQSGVKKIEPVEKDECKDIRSSREVCGCNCKVFCNPETCICSLAGIKCQVDRLSFPCGCSKDGCSNVRGRIEFNPIRVRTHFIHTLMRIDLEKKSEWEQRVQGKSWRPRSIINKTLNKVSSSHVDTDSDGSRPASQVATSLEKTDIVNDSAAASDKLVASDLSDQATQEKVKPDPDHDLVSYNSNERGSCRDCQSSEISDIIMRESQYSGPNQDLESCMQNSNHNFALSEEAQMGLPTVTNPSESLPQVMLFSDDDEAYHAENTTTMFHFPKEESSYSESSDCSSEGSTSVEDQPAAAYQNYQNYNYDIDADGNKICTKIDNPQTKPAQAKINITANGTLGIPQQPQNVNYRSADSNGPSTAPPQQKYINLNNTCNGYKLEPISEILNPIRFSGYSGSDSAAGTATWNSDYGYKNGDRVTHNVPDKPPCTSDSLMKDLNNQITGPADINQSQPEHFYGNSSSAPGADNKKGVPTGPSQAAPKDTASYNGTSKYVDPVPFVTATTNSSTNTRPTRGASTANSTQNNKDQPRYHELKSSTQQAGDSLASSFFSTANQVAASFDLTNQNVPSTVPSFHLASSPSVTKSAADMAPPTSTDLYGLPSAQTAQPVTTFDLPSEEHESEMLDSYEHKSDPVELRPTSPSTEHTSSTQNFGEIIKESIVETVSA